MHIYCKVIHGPYNITSTNMIIHHLRGSTDKAKPKYSEINLSKCHFIHHLYYTDRIEIEPRLRHWQTNDHCLKHGMVSESQQFFLLLKCTKGEHSLTGPFNVADVLLYMAYRSKKVYWHLRECNFRIRWSFWLEDKSGLYAQIILIYTNLVTVLICVSVLWRVSFSDRRTKVYKTKSWESCVVYPYRSCSLTTFSI